MPQTDPTKSETSNQTSEQFFQHLSVSSDEEVVEELAAHFFSITKIAHFIGMNVDELRGIIKYDETHFLSKAYWRGKMKTEILLRFDTLKFAMAGNPLANEDMKQYLSNQTLDENA